MYQVQGSQLYDKIMMMMMMMMLIMIKILLIMYQVRGSQLCDDDIDTSHDEDDVDVDEYVLGTRVPAVCWW